MIIKDLSDAGINSASIDDLRDTLKHLRDRLYALRNNNIFHITQDGKTRDAKDGTFVQTVDLLDMFIDDIIKLITEKLRP